MPSNMAATATSTATFRLGNPLSSSSFSSSSVYSSKILPVNFSQFALQTSPVKSFSVSCTVTREPVPAAPVSMDSDPNGWKRPDSFGRFGKFGGKYVPETLMSALSELDTAFHSLSKDEKFQEELAGILKDYVGRESPLYFAERLSEHYKRPNGEGPDIYLKREDLNHTGAHKINNAVAQALLAKRLGKKRIIAETGAGQHGVATATVCARFGLQCIIYMGAQDMERQALNVFRMRLLGAEVRAVHSGTATLKDATSEAIRDWVTNVETTHYILGSVAGPHPYPVMVREFHAVIGKETRKQALEKWGGKPDVLVACVGGGSNAMGLFHEFVNDKDVRLIGALFSLAPPGMLQTAYTLYPWLLDLSKPKDGLFRAGLSFVMVILAISLWHLWFVKKSKKIVAQLPPGPRGLPIVGYLPFLGTDNLHLSFTELAATYGPIFKLWLGNKLCVVISSPELAKEVVRDHDVTFSERDPPIAAQVASFGCNDIAFDSYSNPRWKNKRKVLATELLTNARLNACYGLRREQVMNGLKDVYENVGKPIDIGKWTYLVALNVAISMILGGELPGEKGAAIEGNLKENSSESMVLLGKPNVSDIFPAIARFDIQGIERGMRKINQQFNRLLESVIEMAIDKEKDEKSSEQKLGFLELLLHLKRNNNEDNASPLTMDEVKGLLVDILVGGTDTTTTMVEWTMAELMQRPEIMEKVKKELSDVVGVNNTVEEFHLSNLSYLNAVIKETFRLHPALPLLVPRCPARSVHLNGYTIPKGSRLFINMWCIHRDPRIWENPLEFRPERFLNDPDNSNHYGNDFRFMPFGSGRRKCPGIPLGEKLLFFILASLLHSFEWRLPHGIVLDMSGKFGIVMKKKEPILLIPTPRLTNLDANC